MIVIADASPLRYLILIDEVRLLPQFYGHILVPPGVVNELTRTDTPALVRLWMETIPSWIVVQSPLSPLSADTIPLGLGEREAIALAEELCAEALLVDDEAARAEATRRGIPIQGTLRILDLAAEHGMVDFRSAIERLQDTNFRASRKLIEFFLERHAQRGR